MLVTVLTDLGVWLLAATGLGLLIGQLINARRAAEVREADQSRRPVRAA